MNTAMRPQREVIRVMLADLKMPGSLEAVDGILAESMADTWRRQKPSIACCRPRLRCATIAA
jgi:hypothetical protein